MIQNSITLCLQAELLPACYPRVSEHLYSLRYHQSLLFFHVIGLYGQLPAEAAVYKGRKVLLLEGLSEIDRASSSRADRTAGAAHRLSVPTFLFSTVKGIFVWLGTYSFHVIPPKCNIIKDPIFDTRRIGCFFKAHPPVGRIKIPRG